MKQTVVPKRLGRRVATFRRVRDLTQEQLAERCGFTGKFISEVERGLVNVPIVTLAKAERRGMRGMGLISLREGSLVDALRFVAFCVEVMAASACE